MRVSFHLELGAGDCNTYTSTDWVKGSVVLALQRAEAVSKITLTLQGKLVCSVIAAATNPLDGTLHAVDNHKLFQISRVIFPQHDVQIPSRGFSLPKGNTPIPFRFRLPVLSTCQNPQVWIKHIKTTLPPTFKFFSPKSDGSATVEYYLRVQVVRSSLFKSDITERLPIHFLPLDPALPPPMLEPTQSKSTRVLRFELPKSPGPASPSGVEVGDARQVTLAATLPAPAILRLGGVLPLEINLTVKDCMGTTPSLVLRTLTLTLHTETTIHVGPNLRTWTATKEIYSSSTLGTEVYPGEPQAVPKELWEAVRVPEGLTPSFTSCSLMQEHFVVVAIGLSYGQEGIILNMKTTINVELHSGVERRPERDEILTLEEEESEEQLAFVPWRVGSDRHLGILGRRDSRTDNAPPPPYCSF